MKKLMKILKALQIMKSHRGSSVVRKAIKLIILGAIFFLIVFVAIFVVVSVLLVTNYEQIYEWLQGIIHFVFGDNPESVWRKYIQQIDGIINNLIQG